MGQLRNILRIWVEGNMPADEIGGFLVSCLYNCDDHLDNRVTRMVDNDETYAQIARVLVEYFQIRDDEDKPLWTEMIPGDLYRRPGDSPSDDDEEIEDSAYETDTDIEEDDMFDFAASEPLVPAPKLCFLSDLLSAAPFDPDFMTDDEDECPLGGINRFKQDGITLLGNAEHSVHIATPQNLTEAMTAELITPMDSDYLIQTNELQDDTSAFGLVSPVDVGSFHLSDLLDVPIEWDWL